MQPIKDAIESGVLGTSWKTKNLRYMRMCDIYAEDGDGFLYHGVAFKNDKGGWTLLGNHGGPFEYPTKKSAQEDIKYFREWCKEG